ncbi:MAG TPA: indole-3-glycerol phosphate synthase TrpC [Gemmatimonadales bacterium]|nr:indole-3-glycerol phosphate synthase TrpC [Gemmatimonadales bacterium]
MQATRPSLDAILADARRRAEALRSRRPELERGVAAARPAQPFGGRLLGSSVGVIGEVKRRSPSAGAIRSDLDPVAHARGYAAGGAVAISVLTDPAHFGGSIADLERVAAAVTLPVLRKDFLVDELQVFEARAAGASAVLLIVRALPAGQLRALARAAREVGVGVLVEAHTEAELEAALEVEPDAVGINSRDLATYAVDLALVERLLARVPAGVPAVAESGIEGRADVERLARAGADAVLVGTSVARAADPAAAVEALVGVPRKGRTT